MARRVELLGSTSRRAIARCLSSEPAHHAGIDSIRSAGSDPQRTRPQRGKTPAGTCWQEISTRWVLGKCAAVRCAESAQLAWSKQRRRLRRTPLLSTESSGWHRRHWGEGGAGSSPAAAPTLGTAGAET